tara:strand:+ start:150 stop:356 length:207 start_codon:yes stop_codon:yes gene_type:complete
MDNENIRYEVTVRTSFEYEDEADSFIEALDDLDMDNMFPTGAQIRKNRIDEETDTNLSTTSFLDNYKE